jgi:peptide/nickel transport system substrate-binding protein
VNAKSRLAAWGTAGALTLALCASVGAGSMAQASGPQHGGTIVDALGAGENVTWYIPFANQANQTVENGQLVGLLYRSLLVINNQYAIDWKMSLAQKVTWNKQGTVYHIFLKKGINWSNGQPVTSANLMFAWHVIQAASNPKAPAPWPYVGAGSGDIPNGVKSIQPNGKYQVTITLDQPTNQEWFLYNGIGQLTPIPLQWNKYPTNITKEITWLGAQATNPAISEDYPVDGAFKLAKAVSNQEWVLVPNKNVSGQKPYVSRFIFEYVASSTAEFAALRTGTVNVGYVPFAMYSDIPQLTQDVVQPAYNFGYGFIGMSYGPNAPSGANKLFAQLYIRQALQYGIDQAGIIKAFYHGLGAQGNGPIPILPKTIFLDPRLYKPLYPFNIKKGQALLEAHGWKLVNGVFEKNGQPLKFTMVYSSGDTATTETNELIAADWKKEGIDVTLEPMQFSTMVSLSRQKYQLMSGIGITYGGSYPTGHDLFGTNGGLDGLYGYSNRQEDALIAATHKPQPTTAANMEAFYAYDYYTARQLPVLWMPNIANLNAWAKNVHGVAQYSYFVSGAFFPQYWWVSH